MLNINEVRAANPLPDVASAYVELKRDGREFKACCPFHGDNTPSFTIYQARGDQAWRFQCFGCGARGDVIDFVREIEGVDFNEAARRLGARELPASRPPPRPLPPDASEDWLPVCPVPAGVDQPFANEGGAWRIWNPKRERESTMRPSASWAYRDASGALLGWVIRCDFDDGGKLTPQVTYCRHRDTGEARWCMRPFPTPRPLLGLDDLAKRPDRPVLVVEGEKSRSAGARLLPGFVVVTWPGGTRGARHTDLTPLRGRAVTFWPDADEPGAEVMNYIGGELVEHGGQLRILDVSGQAKGWDVADADAEGMKTGDVVAWCKARVGAWVAPVDPEPAGPEPEPEGVISNAGTEIQSGPVATPAAAPDEPAAGDLPTHEAEPVDETPAPPASKAYSTMVRWSDLGLELSDRGVPHPNLDNATRILERHPAMLGAFWFDEFLGRVLTTWDSPDEPREWSDSDDVRLALWMQRTISIGKMAVGTARDAVTAAAMQNRRNECTEWLRAQRWDGVRRLHQFIAIGFGAEQNAYTEAVGRCWLVSIVARALNPGCKVDTMPVLEGAQGARKSSGLEALVGKRWFAEAAESVMSKDFFQTLQGKLLVEIAEMDTFSRAEVAAVKRVITCKVDRYRAPYGRRAEDHPRMCVFAGTTNEDEYLRDATGARRFWPVRCGDVDIEWLTKWRGQLFAEAVKLYDAGTPWWDVPVDDARHEQEQRRVSDEWEHLIADWLGMNMETTVSEVLEGALKITPDCWDRQTQMRVASVLKAIGWRKKGDARRNGRVVKVWAREKVATGGNGGNENVL